MYFFFTLFFFKQKTAYEMRISDWSSDVCSSDLMDAAELPPERYARVLADLSRINALTLAQRPTLGFLDRLRARGVGDRPWRILDVGFGAGDMLARIARWGERRGVALDQIGRASCRERVCQYV